MKLKRGLLVVLEGIDGSGKTTQARRLAGALRRAGVDTALFREPTRGPWGRMIRRLARRPRSLNAEEELFLFLLDRRDNVERNLKPALRRKKTIVLDRYYFSTIAYQGARGISRDRIRRLNERFAPPPDLVFILDVPPGRGLGRITGRRKREPLFERKSYLRRVRRNFLDFRGPAFVHLDGRGDPGVLARDIRGRVFRLLHKAASSGSRGGPAVLDRSS
ncbi:MAG: dTMP kinase [Candidatus Aminicenantes bacterium]|nr:dTMP kinase [Candidatus Aminicenantes bacterium]